MSELRIPISPRDHVLGGEDAPVTLIEYGDYQCPHCAAAQTTVRATLQHYKARLRFAYRHFPLATIHPMAKPAAESSEFAGAHGAFWQMHEALFANSPKLSLPLLFTLAVRLNLSPDRLRDALATGAFASKVEEDFAGGARSGVNGTPTFFINGMRHEGGYDFPVLSAAIAAAMHEEAVPIPRIRF